MIYRLGLLVALAACASVTTALPPCVCTRNFKPVCGSDGQTYSNQCLLECQQTTDPDLQLHSQGPCRIARDTAAKPCICTLEYAPVCASNGETYPNKCSLECEGGDLELIHYGYCQPKPLEKLCICPLNYAPVCGTDGKTYDNECALNCKDVSIAHHGACADRAKRQVAKRPCICPYINAPVCGTNGMTYGNDCALKCENGVSVAYYGNCRSKRQAAERPCMCPMIYAPVCGTDGKTYGNECGLTCQDGVSVAHHGECRSKRESCICPELYLPVCGSDGVTYPNECVLKCEKNVDIAHSGDCEREKREAVQVAHIPPLPSCQCTREAIPVCGTDGKTYSNPCLLICAREQNEDLHVEHLGSCKKPVQLREVTNREAVQVAQLPPLPACQCTREAFPVCGTDGKTYSNPCLLNCAREQNEDLEIDHAGPCNKPEVREVNPQPSCTCARIMFPVCASDGRSYNNECLMRCAGEHLTVERFGRCD